MRLIDADALKTKFENADANGLNLVIDRYAIKCIDEAPTVEPTERRGKWIWMGEQGDSRFMCSVCKAKENVPTIMGEPTAWEFCPNCGARMKGTDDE